MKISLSQTKQLLFDLITYTDDVSKEGKPIPRERFDDTYLRGMLGVEEKLRAHAEFGVLEKGTDLEGITDEDTQVEWISFKNLDRAKHQVAFVRYLDGDMEFTEKERDAIAWCYNDRKKKPRTSLKALDEIEVLLGK